MKHIDPTNSLTLEHFCELFEQLPLNDKERSDIKEIYWGVYSVCLQHPEVPPAEAWLATRNTFIAKETQIKERMESNK